jgi:hypothetical protein
MMKKNNTVEATIIWHTRIGSKIFFSNSFFTLNPINFMKMKLYLAVLLNVMMFSCSQEQVGPQAPYSHLTSKNAKEIGSGAGGGTTACLPVTSFTVKGDYRAGETGLSSIDAAYAVKPCTNGQSVRVLVELIKFDTKAVLDAVDNMPLNGKYHYQSTGMYGVYTVKMTVFEAITGATLQTTSFSVSLVPKKV